MKNSFYISDINVNDAVSSGNSIGFDDGNTTGDDYAYDANGSMTMDKNKGITSITYNYLNLPERIEWSANKFITYQYNAAGQKVTKTVRSNDSIKVVRYLDGFQYAGDILQFFPHAEGYVKATPVGNVSPGSPPTGYAYNYVFNYTDHLGNIRLSYTKDPQQGTLKILEENHYYPFGLKHEVYVTGSKMDFKEDSTDPGETILINVLKTAYQYKYQGQERQDELGLNWDSFKWRNYDYAIGRFMTVDPLAEDYAYQSVYSFSSNQPVHAPELEGLESASDLNDKAYNEKSAHSSVPNWLAYRSGAPYQWTNSARVVAGNFATRGASKEAKTSVLQKDGPVQGEDRDRGSKQGAYRHALWQAFITQEFNRSDAKLVGDAHEGGAVNVSQYKNISGIFQADQVADEFNNRIGRNYGAENKDQSWGEIAIGVLNIFKEEGLYTITQNDDGTFNVQRTKITEDEYNQLSERFQNLNNSGRDTDPEDKKRVQRFGE